MNKEAQTYSEDRLLHGKYLFKKMGKKQVLEKDKYPIKFSQFLSDQIIVFDVLAGIHIYIIYCFCLYLLQFNG